MQGMLGVKSGIVVHGCNARGVMGAGLALQIREAFPEVFAAYRKTFDAHGLKPGQVIFVPPNTTRPFWVANAITQADFGRKPGKVYADYEGIATAFRIIAGHARQHGLAVHYPMIGAGLAGGDWGRIREIIKSALVDVPSTFWPPPPRFSRKPG